MWYRGGGLFYAFSSNKNLTAKGKPNWVKTLDVKDPILECEQYGRHFKIYLTLDSSNTLTEKIEDTEIGLKVEDVKENNRITWGVGVKVGDKWTEWKLRVSSHEGINLQTPSDSQQLTSAGYVSTKCTKYKIKSVLGTQAGIEQEVKASDIKFSTSLRSGDRDSSASSKRKEYDVKITTTGSNIKWNDGFNPKAIAESK